MHPGQGAKELWNPRMFNHNLPAKVFDEVCHSGKDYLYSIPSRGEKWTLCWALRKMLIYSAGQSRAERRLVDVTVRMRLAQLQSPVRKHVETFSAQINDAFKVFSSVGLASDNWGNSLMPSLGTVRWWLLVLPKSITACSLLITSILIAKDLFSGFLREHCGDSVHPCSWHTSNLGVRGRIMQHSDLSMVTSCLLVGVKKTTEQQHTFIITSHRPWKFCFPSIFHYCYFVKDKKKKKKPKIKQTNKNLKKERKKKHPMEA